MTRSFSHNFLLYYLIALLIAMIHFDQKLCVQRLVVRKADESLLVVSGHEHGHDELLGGHVDARSGREHEVVDALRVGASGVSVADVAEGCEPRVEGGVRVAFS